MQITDHYIKEVLDTLPISYYLKRPDISLVLSETEPASSFNTETNTITISLPQVKDMIQFLTDKEEIEDHIRNVLYHEVGHALLTPKQLVKWFDMKWEYKDILNVFEDERIESLLRTYFMRVNFRHAIKVANHYPNININNAKTSLEAFYCIVRFREGPEDFLKAVHEIIMRASTLKPVFDNHNTNRFGVIPINDLSRNFVYDVIELYHNVDKWFNEKSGDIPSKGDKTDLEKVEEDKTSKDTLEEQEPFDTEMSDISNTSTESEYYLDTLTVDETIESSVGCQEIEALLNDFSTNSSSIKDQIQYLIENYNKANKRNGAAIPTHHGRLDKRSIIKAQKDKTYKYWVTKNRLGNVSAFSKLHINIFCDVSGSMSKSQETVNRLLLDLANIEKEVPSFSFDLITMSEGEWIEPRSCRKIKIKERKRPLGNFLDKQIFDIYKKVQIPDANNYNIVLFDGDYICGPFRNKLHNESKYQDLNRENLSVFNNNKSIVISDTSNEKYCCKYLQNGNYKITKEYTKELEREVVKTLNKMLR